MTENLDLLKLQEEELRLKLELTKKKKKTAAPIPQSSQIPKYVAPKSNEPAIGGAIAGLQLPQKSYEMNVAPTAGMASFAGNDSTIIDALKEKNIHDKIMSSIPDKYKNMRQDVYDAIMSGGDMETEITKAKDRMQVFEQHTDISEIQYMNGLLDKGMSYFDAKMKLIRYKSQFKTIQQMRDSDLAAEKDSQKEAGDAFVLSQREFELPQSMIDFSKNVNSLIAAHDNKIYDEQVKKMKELAEQKRIVDDTVKMLLKRGDISPQAIELYREGSVTVSQVFNGEWQTVLAIPQVMQPSSLPKGSDQEAIFNKNIKIQTEELPAQVRPGYWSQMGRETRKGITIGFLNFMDGTLHSQTMFEGVKQMMFENGGKIYRLADKERFENSMGQKLLRDTRLVRSSKDLQYDPTNDFLMYMVTQSAEQAFPMATQALTFGALSMAGGGLVRFASMAPVTKYLCSKGISDAAFFKMANIATVKFPMIAASFFGALSEAGGATESMFPNVTPKERLVQTLAVMPVYTLDSYMDLALFFRPARSSISGKAYMEVLEHLGANLKAAGSEMGEEILDPIVRYSLGYKSDLSDAFTQGAEAFKSVVATQLLFGSLSGAYRKAVEVGDAAFLNKYDSYTSNVEKIAKSLGQVKTTLGRDKVTYTPTFTSYEDRSKASESEFVESKKKIDEFEYKTQDAKERAVKLAREEIDRRNRVNAFKPTEELTDGDMFILKDVESSVLQEESDAVLKSNPLPEGSLYRSRNTERTEQLPGETKISRYDMPENVYHVGILEDTAESDSRLIVPGKSHNPIAESGDYIPTFKTKEEADDFIGILKDISGLVSKNDKSALISKVSPEIASQIKNEDFSRSLQLYLMDRKNKGFSVTAIEQVEKMYINEETSWKQTLKSIDKYEVTEIPFELASGDVYTKDGLINIYMVIDTKEISELKKPIMQEVRDYHKKAREAKQSPRDKVLENTVTDSDMTGKLIKKVDKATNGDIKEIVDQLKNLKTLMHSGEFNAMAKDVVGEVLRWVEGGTRISSAASVTFEEYDKLGPGHARLNAALSAYVSKGIMTMVETDVIREVFVATDDSVLERVKLSSRIMLSASGEYRHTDEKNYHEIRLSNLLAYKTGSQKVYSSVETFFHEFGHYGYQTILSDDERKIVQGEYARMYGDLKKRFANGSDPQGADHYTADVHEFFAQTFAEYVLEKKIPSNKLEAIYQRIVVKVRNALNKMINRGSEDVSSLYKLYDKVLAGGDVKVTTNQIEEVIKYQEIKKKLAELRLKGDNVSEESFDKMTDILSDIKDIHLPEDFYAGSEQLKILSEFLRDKISEFTEMPVFNKYATEMFNSNLADIANDLTKKGKRFTGSSLGIYIDLNNLKAVNTEYGHFVGDKMINAGIKSIISSLKASGIKAKVFAPMGDEIYIVFDQSSKMDRSKITKFILSAYGDYKKSAIAVLKKEYSGNVNDKPAKETIVQTGIKAGMFDLGKMINDVSDQLSGIKNIEEQQAIRGHIDSIEKSLINEKKEILSAFKVNTEFDYAIQLIKNKDASMNLNDKRDADTVISKIYAYLDHERALNNLRELANVADDKEDPTSKILQRAALYAERVEAEDFKKLTSAIPGDPFVNFMLFLDKLGGEFKDMVSNNVEDIFTIGAQPTYTNLDNSVFDIYYSSTVGSFLAAKAKDGSRYYVVKQLPGKIVVSEVDINSDLTPEGDFLGKEIKQSTIPVTKDVPEFGTVAFTTFLRAKGFLPSELNAQPVPLGYVKKAKKDPVRKIVDNIGAKIFTTEEAINDDISPEEYEEEKKDDDDSETHKKPLQKNTAILFKAFIDSTQKSVSSVGAPIANVFIRKMAKGLDVYWYTWELGHTKSQKHGVEDSLKNLSRRTSTANTAARVLIKYIENRYHGTTTEDHLEFRKYMEHPNITRVVDDQHKGTWIEKPPVNNPDEIYEFDELDGTGKKVHKKMTKKQAWEELYELTLQYSGQNKKLVTERLNSIVNASLAIRGYFDIINENNIDRFKEFMAAYSTGQHFEYKDTSEMVDFRRAYSAMPKHATLMLMRQAMGSEFIFEPARAVERLEELIRVQKTVLEDMISLFEKAASPHENELGGPGVNPQTFSQEEIQAMKEDIADTQTHVQYLIKTLAYYKLYGSETRFFPISLRRDTKRELSEKFRAKSFTVIDSKRTYDDLYAKMQEDYGRLYSNEFLEELGTDKLEQRIIDPKEQIMFHVLRTAQREMVDNLMLELMRVPGYFITTEQYAALGDLQKRSYERINEGLELKYPILKGLYCHASLNSFHGEILTDVRERIRKDIPFGELVVDAKQHSDRLGQFILMNPLIMGRLDLWQQLITLPGGLPISVEATLAMGMNSEKYNQMYAISSAIGIMGESSGVGESSSKMQERLTHKIIQENGRVNIFTEKEVEKFGAEDRTIIDNIEKMSNRVMDASSNTSFGLIDRNFKIGIGMRLYRTYYNRYETARRRLSKHKALLALFDEDCMKEAYRYRYLTGGKIDPALGFAISQGSKYIQREGIERIMGAYDEMPKTTITFVALFAKYFQIRVSSFKGYLTVASNAIGGTTGTAISLGKKLNPRDAMSSLTGKEKEFLKKYDDKKEISPKDINTAGEIVEKLTKLRDGRSLAIIIRTLMYLIASNAGMGALGYLLYDHYRHRKQNPKTSDLAAAYILMGNDKIYQSMEGAVDRYMELYKNNTSALHRSGLALRQKFMKDARERAVEETIELLMDEDYFQETMGGGLTAVLMSPGEYFAKTFGKGFAATLLPMESPLLFLGSMIADATSGEDINTYWRGRYEKLSDRTSSNWEKAKAVLRKYGIEYTQIGQLVNSIGDPTLPKWAKLASLAGGWAFVYNKNGKRIESIEDNIMFKYMKQPAVILATEMNSKGEKFDVEEKKAALSIVYAFGLADKEVGIGDDTYLKIQKALVTEPITEVAGPLLTEADVKRITMACEEAHLSRGNYKYDNIAQYLDKTRGESKEKRVKGLYDIIYDYYKKWFPLDYPDMIGRSQKEIDAFLDSIVKDEALKDYDSYYKAYERKFDELFDSVYEELGKERELKIKKQNELIIK